MALIVNPPATSAWTLMRERLCDKAMEKCGALGLGETAEPEDRSLCLEALDSVLKQMLWHGYTWPKTLSASASLAFTPFLTNIALPQDFYQVVRVKYLDASGVNEVPITLMTADQWDDIVNKSYQGPFPIEGYIDNFNKLWLWPVVNQAVTVKLYYQQVMLDSVAGAALDLDSPWMLAIPYGIAAEVGDEYGISDKKMARFEMKWNMLLKLGIANEAPNPPNQMSVDNYYGDNDGWGWKR